MSRVDRSSGTSVCGVNGAECRSNDHEHQQIRPPVVRQTLEAAAHLLLLRLRRRRPGEWRETSTVASSAEVFSNPPQTPGLRQGALPGPGQQGKVEQYLKNGPLSPQKNITQVNTSCRKLLLH